MKGTKELISIRLAPDVLEWFRKQAPSGYQTLINSVLSEHVHTRKQTLMHAAGRAQELFRHYYAQCFWHYDQGLRITPDNISLVIQGLRKYGGREGYLLAEELCQ